MDTFLIKWGR